MSLVLTQSLLVTAWPQPVIVQAVGGKLRLLNDTEEPLPTRKNDHFCQAPLTVPNPTSDPSPIETSLAQLTARVLSPTDTTVSVDPDGLLSSSHKASFISLLEQFQIVFDPRIPAYNGAAGLIEGIVNMGSASPPKGSAKAEFHNTSETTLICSRVSAMNSRPKVSSTAPRA